ncbi:Crp/Fnr family transcriptional regulator [Stakelama tenebrarum]|uniref:Crp/Fnr family transcriptional regulator n=1 Tax=Stakelama tenebrarum TaxID=2711215 RepID=A0A6G6Y9M0_9SPHN|nr:Crp/Fnr family transcriptional regulator [Sphingosinithalassobacter tenebrarum]QIG81541.1 Crp/Fnr family transcriptional regulator [Sphingosinithalassobacter tenebrarum]
MIRDSSLCGAMQDNELHALSSIARRKTFPTGQVVAWSGDPNSVCANVVAGAVKVTASTPDGREQIVGLLYPGDFVGHPFAEDATLTVTAVGETDLCLFPRGPFERTLGEHRTMERRLLQQTMESLGGAQQRILSLGRKNAAERIASFLLEVLDRTRPDHEDGPAEIDLPISRGEMADYLGLTIETVSRQLTRLRKDGVIAMAKGDRCCTVLSRERLELIADPD